MSEPPHGEGLEEFWFSRGFEPADPAPRPDRDAMARLARPDITLRGRNLGEVLEPAYDRLRED